MFIRILAFILCAVLTFAFMPEPSVFAAWTEPATVEIENPYIKVTVSKENGGYVITTVGGDILKKTDDNVRLTHRGANMDTSFTSFRIGDEDFIFGNDYGFLNILGSEVLTDVDPAGAWVTSLWSVKNIRIEQRITLINSDTSEQLGTAMITYTVKNTGNAAEEVKSRILIDTQLGDKDFGYYELPKQSLGQGYEYFEFERTWDSVVDPFVRMPADYFVRDNPYASSIVGFGINSVFDDQKPYKMTFAHWANIAATKFDYTPDPTLCFTNSINDLRTADSAAALYYDLGTLAAGGEKSFSTYYGVTANLKNKDNKILINTTAPSMLSFTDDSRTAYAGSLGMDNVVRINTTLTNPSTSSKTYRNLTVVVYAYGFQTQRQTDLGNWIEYNNIDPVYTDIVDFGQGENRVTYFDFKFTPDKSAQLGSFITKVFDMDRSVNELGSYAEEFCLGTTENFIILPGTKPELPAITLIDLLPKISYNDDIRYLTVTGQGVSFFRSDLLNKIELRGENGKIYDVPLDSLIFEQGEIPKSVNLIISGYMEPGRYSLHFVWKTGVNEPALQSVPADFTSANMFVHMSSDEQYRNDAYGIVAIQRDENKKFKVVPYQNEDALIAAAIPRDTLLLTFSGDIVQDKNNKNLYRMRGKDKDIIISKMLNYHGSDLSIEQKEDGSVDVLMDGKITTRGANTTVRNGSAAFKLKTGMEYVVPVYDKRGEPLSGGTLRSTAEDYIQLKWDNWVDTLITIGGFLVDLRYGVIGKICEDVDTELDRREYLKNPGDFELYDIISFGGELDFGFMTPGGAKQARENKYEMNSTQWLLANTPHKGWNSDTDVDIPPLGTEERYKFGAEVKNVLFGGSMPDYLGFNFKGHATLPKIVEFVPLIEGDLEINTIGGYRVGLDAKVEVGPMKLDASLVVKSNPSGAPIPDKFYFSCGGPPPGIPIYGVFYITGGGGGFDKLYDTIYGYNGIPPLTLIFNIRFDIVKILAGNADVELSLRSITLKIKELSLKKAINAKFIDSGIASISWYPNVALSLQAKINFMQILNGEFYISMGAALTDNDSYRFLFEFLARVALSLPDYIPIVGGMEIASAELGGSAESEKIWGQIALLDLIKVGIIYYWGDHLEFVWSHNDDIKPMDATSAGALFSDLTSPHEIGTDPVTGETMYVAMGSNLSFAAGSVVTPDYNARVQQAMRPQALQARAAVPTQIGTNNSRTSHLVSFGEAADYILTVSRTDGTALSDDYLKSNMTVKQNGTPYQLKYYQTPGADATDEQKTAALEDVNMNVAGGNAYIIIPAANLALNRNFLIEFNDSLAYDVGAIYVNPISELKTCASTVNGHSLNVNWTGENISDTAKIIVSVSDTEGTAGVIFNTVDIPAVYSGEKGSAVLAIPPETASGKYYVTVTLSDEDKCYDKYDAGIVTITNSMAPDAPKSVALSNNGNNKFIVNIIPPDSDENLTGYFIDVYEDDTLSESGLYFDKDDEIIIGGQYSMPVMDENGEPTGESIKVGYTPGKSYSVKVRAGNHVSSEVSGEETYHCSAYMESSGVVLCEATPPVVTIAYDKTTEEAVITSDVPITGELFINGGIADNSWYKFETASKTFKQVLSLPDGEHTLEFNSVNAEGDRAIITEIVSVDTTPPVILLETPLSGGTFGSDTLKIRAMAESDATYTFKLNGTAVQPLEEELFSDNMLRCSIPLGEAAYRSSITIEIIAEDAAGNITDKLIELTNARMADINDIIIYDGDLPVENGRIELNEERGTAELRIMGMLPDGGKIDITDCAASSFEILGGMSVSLNRNTVSAATEGQTLLRATFDLGGGRMLQNGAVVFVVEQGVAVTGKIRAYNPHNPATIQLLSGDAEKYKTLTDTSTATGQVEQSFRFDDVEAGTYTLVITKDGYAKYTVLDVVVGDTDVDMADDPREGVKNIVLVCGDYNGDGIVDARDLSILWSSANYGKRTDEAGNPECDVNGDGIIDARDLSIVWGSENYGKRSVVIEPDKLE